MDEEMKKRLESIEKSIATKDDEFKKAMATKDEEIKKLREDLATGAVEKRKVEISKRAEGLKYLPGKTEDVVKNLLDIEAKAGSAAAEAVLKSLEVAAGLIRKSRVFDPAGVGQGPTDSDMDGDAIGKVRKGVAELQSAVAKAGGKKLSPEQAFQKVWDTLSPEDKKQYHDEMNGAAA